jgi:Acetyltransferase (GNAT) family
MGVSSSISRITDYYSRHGLRATVSRFVLGVKRALFSSRMLVFYCDLPTLSPRPVNIPSSMKVERVTRETELRPQDFEEITSFWNPAQARRNIKERFTNGASLWLIKSEDAVAGYGWTLQGCTIAEYYFPMGPKDVQLFDFFVFPKFRGRALHWLLTAYILQALAAEGAARAFADTGEWNQPQISSFRMTPFRRLGVVRSFTLFGHTFVSWSENGSAEQLASASRVKDKALTMARPHE